RTLPMPRCRARCRRSSWPGSVEFLLPLAAGARSRRGAGHRVGTRRRAPVGDPAGHAGGGGRRAAGRPEGRAGGPAAGGGRGPPGGARPGARARAGRGLPARGAPAAGRPAVPLPPPGGGRGPAAIAHYDALRRDEAWGAVHAPDRVLRVGALPTSKPLRGWLAGLDALQVAFDPESAWQDPAGAVGTIVAADPRTTLEA